MTRFATRFALKTAVVLALALSVSACDRNTPPLVGPDPIVDPIPPPEPPPPEPPAGPTLASVQVSVPKSIIFLGKSVQATAVAKYDDETEKDVTLLSVWSSSNQVVATVSGTGLVTAGSSAGAASIKAEFQGKIGEVVVTMTKDVPWSELPPISVEAKNYIVRANFHNPDFNTGAVTRWVNMPIPVYADPDISRQTLVDALNLWERAANGRLSFRIVDTREQASTYGIVFNNPPRRPIPDGRCDTVYIDSVHDNVITRVTREKKFSSGCYDSDRRHIARALGFAIGLDYTPGGSGDVMNGGEDAVWYMSPLLSESVSWLYSVEPGTRPQ